MRTVKSTLPAKQRFSIMGQKEEEVVVTTQPDGVTVGGQKVQVEMPKLDLEQIHKGGWSVSMTDCLDDVPVCEKK